MPTFFAGVPRRANADMHGQPVLGCGVLLASAVGLRGGCPRMPTRFAGVPRRARADMRGQPVWGRGALWRAVWVREGLSAHADALRWRSEARERRHARTALAESRQLAGDVQARREKWRGEPHSITPSAPSRPCHPPTAAGPRGGQSRTPASARLGTQAKLVGVRLWPDRGLAKARLGTQAKLAGVRPWPDRGLAKATRSRSPCPGPMAPGSARTRSPRQCRTAPTSSPRR